MSGVAGWNVAATIDVEPNSGPKDTTVTITIAFTDGAGDVARIDIQQFGGAECEYLPLGTFTDAFAQQSATVWVSRGELALVLTGNSAIVRFVAVNSSDVEIALGDVAVNGGC